MAHFAAQLDRYDRSIDRFEAIAAASVDNNLTKFSVKEYLLKAGLVHICSGDLVKAKMAIERYEDLDMTFGSTRECQLLKVTPIAQEYMFSNLLKNVLAAVEAGDRDAFTEHVRAYDNLSRLDTWKTSILVKIKNNIHEEPSLT